MLRRWWWSSRRQQVRYDYYYYWYYSSPTTSALHRTSSCCSFGLLVWKSGQHHAVLLTETTTTPTRFLATTTTARRNRAAKPQQPPNSKRRQPRLPCFSHEEDNNNNKEDDVNERKKKDNYNQSNTSQAGQATWDQPNDKMRHFPIHFRPGVEMDVKIVKISTDYALCRPVDYPQYKGFMPHYELCDIMEREFDATYLVELHMIYRASILHLHPPDRIVFSLRRVRTLLRDDFQPVTIAIFNLHPGMEASELRERMEKSAGEVIDVELHTKKQNENQPSYVTFLHEADAMKAIQTWNKTLLPCLVVVDDQDPDEQCILRYRRVRCKKSDHQLYRKRLQSFLDTRLEEKIKIWDETPSDRILQQRADEALLEAMPWHVVDRENDRALLFSDEASFPEYTVPNNPRKA